MDGCATGGFGASPSPSSSSSYESGARASAAATPRALSVHAACAVLDHLASLLESEACGEAFVSPEGAGSEDATCGGEGGMPVGISAAVLEQVAMQALLDDECC